MWRLCISLSVVYLATVTITHHIRVFDMSFREDRPAILLIGRWGTRPGRDWYPWFHTAADADVHIPEMPEPDNPTPAAWIDAVQRHLAEIPADTRVLLVGHSVGCQAIVRALSASPAVRPLLGAVFVAGWWTVGQPWPSLEPWCKTDYDFSRARKALPRSIVLVSTNDPFNPDFEENGALWTERLGSEVHVVPGAGHFNASPQPAVLEAVGDILGGSFP